MTGENLGVRNYYTNFKYKTYCFCAWGFVYLKFACTHTWLMTAINKTSSSLEQSAEENGIRQSWIWMLLSPSPVVKKTHLELPRSVYQFKKWCALRKVQSMLKTLLTTINICEITNMKTLSLNPRSIILGKSSLYKHCLYPPLMHFNLCCVNLWEGRD